MNHDNRRDFLGSYIKEVDWLVVTPALIVVLGIVTYCMKNTDTALATFSTFFNGFVIRFTSLYLWYPLILIILGAYLMFSKYGDIVMGDPEDKPTMTTWQYIAIILAMAFGATIMRTGAINWALAAQDPPAIFAAEAFSKEAIIFGNSFSMYAWGFSTFGVFCLASPAMSYYMHVRKKPTVRLSTIFAEAFNPKIEHNMLGKFCDFVFVVAFVCAAATLVGLATPVVSAVFARVIGIGNSLILEIILTIVMVVIFTTSACLGLKKGIEKLSEINIYLACLFMLLIVIVGPTLFIIDYATECFGHYLSNYFMYTFHANSMGKEADFVQSYLVFWNAYNAGWAILHSMFIAIVSRGRTVKEILGIYFVAPQTIVLIFTAVLGGIGVDSYLTGTVPVFELLASVGVAETVTDILQSLPMPIVMMVIYTITAMIFLSTTMDSSTYTIATYVCTKDLTKHEPSKILRFVWAIVIAVLAITMQIVGGLAPLDVLNGIFGIPIIILQFFVIFAGFKMMNDDKAYIHNVRKKKYQVLGETIHEAME